MGGEADVRVLEENGAVYIYSEIGNVSNESIEDGYIFEDADNFSGLILCSGNYEGGIRDITILHGRAQKTDVPITHDWPIHIEI